MKKRILSFILVLVMMLTMIPILESEAKAASNETPNYTSGVTSTTELTNRLNALMNKYVGTYWTTDGTPCVSSSNCHSKYYHGVQCKGFAGYIFNDLFCGGYIGAYDNNKYYIPKPTNAKEIDKAWNFSSTDTTTVKNILSKAQPGDFIQVRRRNQSYGHSMIVVSVDSNGVTVFDCNSDGKCGVKKYTQSWATFASKNSGMSLYHSTKYPNGGSTPAPAQSYIEVYPKSYDTKIPVYSSAGGEKLSNRYIDGSTDICRILKFDGSSTWCYVSYPSSSEADGWFEAWVPVTTFVPSTKGTKWVTDQAYTLYRRSDKNNTFENIPKGTEVSIVDETGNMKQVAFKLNTTVSRMGWIEVHTHNYSKKVTNPTCTEKGYTTYTCSCGDSYKDNYTNAAGHKTEIKNAKSATCTATGYNGDEVCKTCGKTIKTGESIPALGHKWNKGELAKDATCTEDGVVTYICQNDTTHKKTETLPAKGHTVTRTDEVPATCETSGLTEGSHCSVCNTVIVEQAATLPLGHKWGLAFTVPATCDKEGYSRVSCLRCTYTKSETYPPSHSYGPGLSNIITWPATCETEGFTKYTCTKCDFTEKRDIVPALGHKDENSDYVCDTCSKALCTDHTPVTINGKVATCTEAGLTDGSKCEKCGKVLEEQKVIEALGHNWLEDTFAPGCEFDGWTVHWCTRCNEEYEDNIVPSTGHKWDEGKVTKEPTETTEGIKQFTCTACKETKEESIPVTTHKHTFKDTVVAPSCTEGGYTLHECSCGESYKDTYTNALGHTPELKNAKDASCTTDGYTGDEICKSCGKTIKSGEVIKAKGHSYASGKCSVCGAADPDYKDPTPTPADNPFKDVKESDWFYAPVLWAVQNNVTGGTSPNTFGPNNFCTRAQVVTFLWAANGKPEPTSMNNPFTDVSDNAWYCKAVMWAVEQGITGGTSATTFSPDAYCTRAQVATFLYAAQGKPAVKNTNNEFIDVPNNAWYLNPVLWAAENGITGGIGGGKFGPDQTCTRAQIATFLYKAMS